MTTTTSRRPGLIPTLLVGALVSIATSLTAQDDTNAVKAAEAPVSPERPPYRPWMVALGAGTDGIFGGGVSWRFSDHLGTRVGVGYVRSTWDDVAIAGIKYNVTLRLLSEPLTLDVYPWTKRSFRVSLGLMFNQNELSGTASSTGTITVDGQPYPITPRSLTMRIKQQPVNPYLGIGGNLFYFDRAHRWAVAGELGVAYTGAARVSLDRTASSTLPDDALNKAKNRLQDYADQYRWWPVAKLAVTYSF